MILNMLKDALLVGLLFLPTYIHCACTEESVCVTPDGKAGVCLGGVCSVLTPGVRNDLKFTIIVKYPEAQLQVNASHPVVSLSLSLSLSLSRDTLYFVMCNRQLTFEDILQRLLLLSLFTMSMALMSMEYMYNRFNSAFLSV